MLSRIPRRSPTTSRTRSRAPRAEIAWLLVHEEIFLAEGLERGHFEWVELPTPATMAEIVARHDARHEELTRAHEEAAGLSVEKRMPFTFQGQEVMNETGYENGWITLFDQVHHRGQLSDVSPAHGIDRAADLRA